MADDSDEKASAESEAPASSGGKLQLILLILVAVQTLLLAGGVFYLASSMGTVLTEVRAVAAANGEGTDEKDGDSAAPAKATVDTGAKAIFYTLRPEFTANFDDGTGMHYLQLSLDVMARDQEVIDEVQAQAPKLRYEILKVIGRQDAAIYTQAGKDAMLADILDALRQNVRTPDGKTVEAVYYTSLVVQ